MALLAVMIYLGLRLVVEDINQVFGYISMGLGTLFSLFVINLIVFHTYILSKNITTWECLSWTKVSYL